MYSPLQKENKDFCEKSHGKICGVKKKCYLCTAFREMHLSIQVVCGNSSVGRARPCQGRGREFESRLPLTYWKQPIRKATSFTAQVAELVDAHVSGACAARRAGSSPVLGTTWLFRV